MTVTIRTARLSLGDLVLWLDDHDAGYACQELDLGYPSPRDVTNNRPDQWGVDDQTRYWGSRPVSANITAWMGDEMTVDDIARLFAPFMVASVRPVLTYTTHSDLGGERMLVLRPADFSSPMNSIAQRAIHLAWVCPDGLAYDADEQEAVAFSGSSFLPGREYDLVYRDPLPPPSEDAAHWDDRPGQSTMYTQSVRALQPLAYYRLNDVEPPSDEPFARLPSMADSSAYHRHGTYVGPVTTAPSLLPTDDDPAARFSGDFTNGQYVGSMPFSDPNRWSIEAWIKPSRLSGVQFPVSIGVGQGSLRIENNQLQIQNVAVGTEARSTETLEVGQVYHCVATKDASGPHLYQNGRDVTEVVFSFTYGAQPTGCYIGANAQLMYHLASDIDEVAVYDFALSPAQVLANYRHGTFGKTASWDSDDFDWTGEPDPPGHRGNRDYDRDYDRYYATPTPPWPGGRRYPPGGQLPIAGLIDNRGDTPLQPRFEIHGPITGPIITGTTEAGREWRIVTRPSLRINARQYVEIDSATRTVAWDTGEPILHQLDWLASTWPFVPARSWSTLRLRGGTTNELTQVHAHWRAGYLS